MGLVLAMALKFYSSGASSGAKRLKLNVKKFWGQIPFFGDVTAKKLLGCLFAPPYLIGQVP